MKIFKLMEITKGVLIIGLAFSVGVIFGKYNFLLANTANGVLAYTGGRIIGRALREE